MSVSPVFPDTRWRPARTAALLVASVVAACSLAGAPLPEGALAPTDLITPVDIQVTLVVSAARVASADGRLLPIVVQHDPAAATAALREFDAAFERARSAFHQALERDFGARTLDDARIASRRFHGFRSEFVAGHPEFPVGHVLAEAWARGESGEVVRARLRAVLASVLDRHLIGEAPQAGTVFVVHLAPGAVVRSWSEASSALVRAADPGAVIPVDQARRALWAQLGVGERLAGGFLETLVRDTCRYDARLTALFLRERLGDTLEGRYFGRGEPIVRRGERVDTHAAEALRQLEALGLAPLTPLPPPAPQPATPTPRAEPVAPVAMPPVEAPALSAPEPIAPAVSLTRWMIAMAGVGLLTLALGIWSYGRLRRLRNTAALTLRPALAPAGADLREIVAPHLAREIAARGTRLLYDQREALLEHEAIAAERVAEMETRVARVHPAIQERMRLYEQRIKSLERELQER